MPNSIEFTNKEENGINVSFDLTSFDFSCEGNIPYIPLSTYIFSYEGSCAEIDVSGVLDSDWEVINFNCDFGDLQELLNCTESELTDSLEPIIYEDLQRIVDDHLITGESLGCIELDEELLDAAVTRYYT